MNEFKILTILLDFHPRELGKGFYFEESFAGYYHHPSRTQWPIDLIWCSLAGRHSCVGNKNIVQKETLRISLSTCTCQAELCDDSIWPSPRHRSKMQHILDGSRLKFANFGANLSRVETN